MKVEHKRLFKKVKLLVLDVDGVLTNEEIMYDDRGRELKIFNVKDGLGIVILGKMGVPTVLLTAKDSPVVRRRARDFRAECIAGLLPKENALASLCKRYAVGLDEICFVGDDVIDLGVMRRVGAPVAVSNACRELKQVAAYTTKHAGGQGAVREVVELILREKGMWTRAVTTLNQILLT